MKKKKELKKENVPGTRDADASQAPFVVIIVIGYYVDVVGGSGAHRN